MKNLEIYRCSRCGLQIQLTVAPENEQIPPPVCCGINMRLLRPNIVESAALEKHLPVVEAIDNGILVKVGAEEHPMGADHFIEWIEVINGSYVNRYHLKPGDKPQATFYVPLSPSLIIRESCNKHGIWQITGKGEK